jgi:hypothetical protein
MTQKVDLAVLRAADVPSFGSLERAILFIRQHLGQRGMVYPNS